MKNKFTYLQSLKFLGWGLGAIALVAFMLFPLLPLDHSGEAFAQTVPPPDDDDDDVVIPPPQATLTPGAPVGPPVASCGCLRPPVGSNQVTVNFRPESSANLMVAVVPPGQPTTPSVPLIVPQGLITQPVGVIDFDFGMDRRGTLIVPAHPSRPLLVRLQTLSELNPPLPLDEAGAIANLPAGSRATRVLHVFTLDLFYADTGEEINIHDRELIIAFCPRNDYSPEKVVLLRFDEPANQYEIVDQVYNRFNLSMAAYLPRTSTFVLTTVAGDVPQISPLLLPGDIPVEPPATCPPAKDPCQCQRLPTGLAVVEISMLPTPPTGVPPLTGDGFIFNVPASTGQSFSNYYVPGGVITEPVGSIDFSIVCDDSSLIVPSKQDKDLVTRVQFFSADQPPLPLDNPGAIPDLPASITPNRLIGVFSIDLYDGATGDPIDQHTPELILRICPRVEYNPETPILLQYDEASNSYTIPTQSYAHPVRCLVAYLDQTSTFVLSSLVSNGTGIVPTPVLPAGLPRTGDEASLEGGYPLRMGMVLGLVALVTVSGLYWRGNRRFD